uniref:Putative secreted protein n=1 Tax=Anopheles marajoara TaxID=58244 RepID=A0A2M4C7U3_9DIPT
MQKRTSVLSTLLLSLARTVMLLQTLSAQPVRSKERPPAINILRQEFSTLFQATALSLTHATTRGRLARNCFRNVVRMYKRLLFGTSVVIRPAMRCGVWRRFCYRYTAGCFH